MEGLHVAWATLMWLGDDISLKAQFMVSPFAVNGKKSQFFSLMLLDTPLFFSYEFCLTALVAGLQNTDCRIVTITASEPPAISGLRGVESHSPEEQLVLSGRVCSADRVRIEWISPAGVAGESHITGA